MAAVGKQKFHGSDGKKKKEKNPILKRVNVSSSSNSGGSCAAIEKEKKEKKSKEKETKYAYLGEVSSEDEKDDK